MADIKLIVTDIDGTLVGEESDFSLYNDFRYEINKLRETKNAVWAVCTGRSKRSLQGILSPMRLMGITPEFAILKHAYIYSVSKVGYMPHVIWNGRVRLRSWLSNKHDALEIVKWHDVIMRVSRGAKSMVRDKTHVCVRFENETLALEAGNIMFAKLIGHEHLRVARNGNDIEIRRIPQIKGLAVNELARHLGLAPDNVLAIGNGYNDLSMLKSNVATRVGCPANAEPEVFKLVNESGGHIACEASLGGVLDTLKAFENDSVRSDLPEGWEETASVCAESRRDRSSARYSHRKLGPGLWIFLASAYVVLLVFANYGLVPFAGVIMKPYHLVLNLVRKIGDLFL